jgi:hypothetical protein
MDEIFEELSDDELKSLVMELKERDDKAGDLKVKSYTTEGVIRYSNIVAHTFETYPALLWYEAVEFAIFKEASFRWINSNVE